MKRNKLLKLAATVCKVFGFFQFAGILIATIILIHWHTDKEFYRKVTVTNTGNINLNVKTTETVVDKTVAKKEDVVAKIIKEEPAKSKITLADLTPAAVYFNYIQGVVLMVLLFFIFKEFGQVVRSAEVLQTFRTDNITSFRKIGKYLLIIFLVSGLHFIATEAGKDPDSQIGISFDPMLIILILVAYVLAEIFKEGNRLQEEEKLTI